MSIYTSREREREREGGRGHSAFFILYTKRSKTARMHHPRFELIINDEKGQGKEGKGG